MKKGGITLPTAYVDVTNEEMEYMEGSFNSSCGETFATIGVFGALLTAIAVTARVCGGKVEALAVGLPGGIVLAGCAIAATVYFHDEIGSALKGAASKVGYFASNVASKIGDFFSNLW